MSNKRRDPEASWEVKLDDVSPLRSIVEAVQNVVSRVTFKITRVDDDSPYFLIIDTADVAYVSCISVRYQLDKVYNSPGNDEIKFCVDCKHIVPCLANIRQEHTLTLEGHECQSNPKVIIRTFDPDHPSHETKTELDTFVDSDNVQLFPMDHDILLEIDLFIFRNLLKQAQVAKAEQLVIKIFIKETSGQNISFTNFSVQGEFKHSSQFCHEVSKDEDGSMVVRAATDGMHSIFETENISPIYEGIFPVDKVAGFMKPLQCRMLTAKVKQNMPIMFSHCIGGSTDEKSKIRFLIAPVNPDID